MRLSDPAQDRVCREPNQKEPLKGQGSQSLTTNLLPAVYAVVSFLSNKMCSTWLMSQELYWNEEGEEVLCSEPQQNLSRKGKCG